MLTCFPNIYFAPHFFLLPPPPPPHQIPSPPPLFPFPSLYSPLGKYLAGELTALFITLLSNHLTKSEGEPFIHSFINTFLQSNFHPSCHPSFHPSLHPSFHPSFHIYIHTSFQPFNQIRRKTFHSSFIHSFIQPFKHIHQFINSSIHSLIHHSFSEILWTHETFLWQNTMLIFIFQLETSKSIRTKRVCPIFLQEDCSIDICPWQESGRFIWIF